MPDGFVQDYASRTIGNAYSYGLVELTIQCGRIQDVGFISTRQLEAMHATRRRIYA